MTGPELDQAELETKAICAGFDLLVKKKKFPKYDAFWTWGHTAPGQKAVQFTMEMYNSKGKVEFAFTMDFPFKYSYPDAVAKDPLLNIEAAWPTRALTVVEKDAWEELKASLFGTLQHRYPHVIDMPMILQQEINKMIKTQSKTNG